MDDDKDKSNEGPPNEGEDSSASGNNDKSESVTSPNPNLKKENDEKDLKLKHALNNLRSAKTTEKSKFTSVRRKYQTAIIKGDDFEDIELDIVHSNLYRRY